MDSSAQLPGLSPNPLLSVFSGQGGGQAPGLEPTPISPVVADVVVSLSPEALAVLEGALEPSEALADAVRSGRAGSNPLLDAAGARGIFEIYGQVDVNQDGELDGPAGAASVDDEDQPGLALGGADAPAGDRTDPEALSEEEEQQVAELRSRDAEVRAHEFAHAAAGGGLTGAIRFSYQTGPDGKRYAIGGSVSIDTSPGSTPEETISKAQRIRAAAMAPADPSGQDRAVAAQAGAMESRARAHLSRERANEVDAALSSAGAQLLGAGQTGSGEEPGPAAPAPAAPTPAVSLDAPSMGVTAVLHSSASASETLADFSGGSVAQARLYSMPAPSSGVLHTPVEPQDLPADLLR